MDAPHLSPEEIALWAEGLLPARRAIHLADCARCRETAERERRLFVALARVERLTPSREFADGVMATVNSPQGSGRTPES
ncbi:MAG TPA: hypothetical protein VN848_03570 [Gemmatimonadales bacterium]|nr:hypothetical protein [Gemmatimonadales bacterium]